METYVVCLYNLLQKYSLINFYQSFYPFLKKIIFSDVRNRFLRANLDLINYRVAEKTDSMAPNQSKIVCAVANPQRSAEPDQIHDIIHGVSVQPLRSQGLEHQW